MKKLVSLIILILIVIFALAAVHAAPIIGADKAVNKSAEKGATQAPGANVAVKAADKLVDKGTSSNNGSARSFAAASAPASSAPAHAASSPFTSIASAFSLPTAGEAAPTPLEFIISWASTDDNKRTLITVATEANLDLSGDSKWNWVLTLLGAPIEFESPAAVENSSAQLKPNSPAKPTTAIPSASTTAKPATVSPTDASAPQNRKTEAPGQNIESTINSRNLLQLTKPLKIDNKQSVTYEKFLVCGKVAFPRVNVSLAVYNSNDNRYEDVSFVKDKKGVRIYSDLFAEELQLQKGRNRVKVTAYTADAENNPRFGENLQILYFDVYYIDRHVISAGRDITDYFTLPAFENFKFDMSKSIKID